MFTKSLWPVRRFYAVARPECDQMDYSALCLSTLENAKSMIAIFGKSQTSIFSKMVKIWLLNGKVSLISIKLYLKVVSYHLSKNWKNTTTFALFLKVCLTQKRTETKHSTQNRAKALLLDFFPQKVLIESQLSRSVSVYILSVMMFHNHALICLLFRWLSLLKIGRPTVSPVNLLCAAQIAITQTPSPTEQVQSPGLGTTN